MTKLILAAVAVVMATSSHETLPAPYLLTHSVELHAPDRWDYVVFEAQTNTVMVAHGDRLAVVDAKSESFTGDVTGIGGYTHGSAVSAATGEGFVADGHAGDVVAFDLRTLKIIKTIPGTADGDAMALDHTTGRLFVVQGARASVTVVDVKSDTVVAVIDAGEDMEYAVSDGKGTVYVAGDGAEGILRVDAHRLRISARWPTPGCINPHGIAVDARSQRVFLGCSNKVMLVVDANTGKTLAKLAIGDGSDEIVFDAVRHRVFSSNGSDGTISAYQQVSPNRYLALPPIATMITARTMAVDPATGRLFVAGAGIEPGYSGAGRPTVTPGSLRLMVFTPTLRPVALPTTSRPDHDPV